MPGKPLTPVEIGKIDAYRASGKSIQEISVIMNRNRKTISRFVSKWRQCSPSKTPSHKPRLGRKPKIGKHASRVMKFAFLKSPRKSCRQLKSENPQIFEGVSVRTLQDHACRKLKFRSRVAKKKPLLTKKNIEKRYKFAMKTKSWTVDQWRSVMWSDESSFKVSDRLPQKVRRPPHSKGKLYGSPYLFKYTMATVKMAQKLMIWGSMTGNAGRGSLFVIPKGQTVTGESYLNILKEKLVNTMDIHGATFFMHDGAPVHTCKKVKQWLTENKIECLDWPPQSPDLNPIENIWY